MSAEVLPALHVALRPLVDDGQVWNIAIDTYEREQDRYGGREAIVFAEELFFADSDAVMEILRLLPTQDGALDARWRLCIYGMACLLDDFGFAPEEKLEIVERMRNAFAREFHVDESFRHQSGASFRKERISLESLMQGRADVEPLVLKGNAFCARSARNMPAIQELRRIVDSGMATCRLGEIAQSLLHMHANRLLRSAHRKHELILYDFLARLYESQIARAKKKMSRGR